MALNIGLIKTPSKVPGKPEIKLEKTIKVEKKPIGLGLEAVLAGVVKSKGDKVVVYANKIPPVRRMPTGIFEFDFATGGGFPCGRYSIVYGPSSSWKTNIAYAAVANAQRLPPPCNKAVWANPEQTFDPEWAAKFGVDIEKLLVLNGGYGEETADLVDAFIRADDVAILVVDSIAAMISSKEIAQSMEKFDVGTSALLIKRMVNKMMIAFSEESKKDHNPCVILINQTRYKIGVMFGDPETMPGGEAQKFLCSLWVRVYGKNRILKDVNPDLPAFKDVHAVIKKSKVPVRKVAFDFSVCANPHSGLNVGDTDSFNMVADHLKTLGLMVKKSKGWEVDGMLFPTLLPMKDQYNKDWEFRLMLQKMVIDSYHDKMILVDDPDEKPPIMGKPGIAIPVQSIAEDIDASLELEDALYEK